MNQARTSEVIQRNLHIYKHSLRDALREEKNGIMWEKFPNDDEDFLYVIVIMYSMNINIMDNVD